MITVEVMKTKRMFIDGIINTDIGFNIKPGETKVINDTVLRDNSIKNALLTGLLRIKEGKINFIHKGAKCFISAKKNDRAYILENGNLLVKDLETNTFVNDNLTQEFILKMTQKLEA